MADLQSEMHEARDALLPSVRAAREADRAERNLGRAIALGLPVVTVTSTLVVAVVASVGSALLVLAAGVLLGTIGLLWASVRTLSGDAPLPLALETVAAGNRRIDELAEQKRRVLRSLKDLENEHAIEKIDDADYEQMASRYRDEAKSLMREMDQNVAPAVAEAERLVSAYFGAIGLAPAAGANAGSDAGAIAVQDAVRAKATERERPVCAACKTSNDPDAAFCKKCGTSIQTNGASVGGKTTGTAGAEGTALAADAGSASKASED